MRSSADENHGDCYRGRLSRLLRSLQVKGVVKARSNPDEIESERVPQNLPRVVPSLVATHSKSMWKLHSGTYEGVYIIEWPLPVMESVLESRPPDIQ